MNALDENALQEAAEAVADRHIRNCTAEFVEWLEDYTAGRNFSMETFATIVCALPREAHLVQKAKGLADIILNDFRSWVANLEGHEPWPLARKLYREVRGEAA